jgi:hypothetical protein
MHFLIFIPGEHRQDRAVLDDAGFGDLLKQGDPDPLVAIIDCVGPDEKTPGAIVLPFSDGDESKNPPLGFLPDRQTWLPVAASDCWIGWVTASPPTADDLARSTPLPYAGPMIRLGDERPWSIPCCLDQRQVMVPTAAGSWTTDERPRWPELYAMAAPMIDTLEAAMKREVSEDTPLTIDNAAATTFLAELLCINYRLTTKVIGALGLLDEDRLVQLVAIATDYQRLQTLAKDLDEKKPPGPTS